MVGKNPHRPEGKARSDNEGMQAAWMNAGEPHANLPSDKHLHEKNMELMDQGAPQQVSAEEQIGGSRPGVESRVKEAIARREEREE